jgi:hypothetical protein
MNKIGERERERERELIGKGEKLRGWNRERNLNILIQ